MSAAVTMGHSVNICTCTPCAVGIACEQRCDHASNVDHVVAPCPGFRVADGETALGEGAGGGEVFH
ncbi:MAG: hypothetical protein EBU84_09750 [Actinobacteria bacterium]|nr:hypothetical protein [Actinomycetota bacterium]